MERAEPVIRFGNISLMLPFEKVKVRLNKNDEHLTPVEAYLVEARSWGGQSGSPALFNYPPFGDKAWERERIWSFKFRLPLILGLVHGQYERHGPLVSAGVAIVIPADKIRETIMQKKLADERSRVAEKSPTRAKDAPKPIPGSARPDVNFTQEDFTNALERASRKVSQPESESDET